MKNWLGFGVLWFLFLAVIVWVVLSPWPPHRLTPVCDRLFEEFMTSRDPVVVDRNGWLLYGLHCDWERRMRRF